MTWPRPCARSSCRVLCRSPVPLSATTEVNTEFNEASKASAKAECNSANRGRSSSRLRSRLKPIVSGLGNAPTTQPLGTAPGPNQAMSWNASVPPSSPTMLPGMPGRSFGPVCTSSRVTSAVAVGSQRRSCQALSASAPKTESIWDPIISTAAPVMKPAMTG